MKNIIIYVAVVAVIGVGVWYYKGGPAADAPVGASPTPSGVVSVSPSPTPTPTPLRTLLGTPVSSVGPSPSTSPVITGTPTPAPTITPESSASPTPGIIIRESVIYAVDIRDFGFNPSPLMVKKGDVVIFTNRDTPTHTVTALDKSFNSKNIRSGDQWMLETANLPVGTYEYQCTLHTTMRGIVVVQ